MPPTPAPDTLLVGSFPPIGGTATAASLAALRRAWDEGEEVVTASLRPGAADLVARVAGPGAGLRLEQARRAAGRPPKLVLGLEAEQLGGAAGAAATVTGLLAAFGRFEQVSVLLTGPLRLPAGLARALWTGVDRVVVEAGGEGDAAAAGVPEGKIHSVARSEGPARQAGVSLLGPPEVLPKELPLVAVGALGRRVLGRHFMPVRARAIGLARRAKRALTARAG